MTIVRTYAGLYFYSDDLVPERLARVLKLDDYRQVIKGAPLALDNVAGTTMLGFTSQHEIASLIPDEHVGWCLSQIRGMHTAIRQELGTSGRIRCAVLAEADVPNAGVTIGAASLAELAMLNGELMIDAWGPA
ncbi:MULTISPECIES: hypothetical protein [unclassified Cupriavidus]|uniref:hypothetical protein n=1 Tax=unclassified Cupriavidus TaxID=2640874 RepID=UPI00313B4F2A